MEVKSDNVEDILKEANQLKEDGNFVKILKTEEFDTTKIQDEFHVVDKTVKDITNRGINSSMSTEDKLKEYLKIKEVPEEFHEAYIKQAINIIDITQGADNG